MLTEDSEDHPLDANYLIHKEIILSRHSNAETLGGINLLWPGFELGRHVST